MHPHPHHTPQRATPGQKCIHPCPKAVRCRIWDRCIAGPTRLTHSSTRKLFIGNGACQPSGNHQDHHPAPDILVSTITPGNPFTHPGIKRPPCAHTTAICCIFTTSTLAISPGPHLRFYYTGYKHCVGARRGHIRIENNPDNVAF